MNVYVQRDDVGLGQIHRFRIFVQSGGNLHSATSSTTVPPTVNLNSVTKKESGSIEDRAGSGGMTISSGENISKQISENNSSTNPKHANSESSPLLSSDFSSSSKDYHKVGTFTDNTNAINIPEQTRGVSHTSSSPSVGTSFSSINLREVKNPLAGSDSTAPFINSTNSVLWIRVRNREARFRQAAYLQGPFTLCVSVWNDQFFDEKNSLLNFDPQVQPSTSFWVCVPYSCFSNQQPIYIEIASQAIFKDRSINFELAISQSQHSIRAMSAADIDTLHAFPALHVEHQTPENLWRLPYSSFHSKNSHLVVLTHGMHSNVGADMEYLKEKLIESSKSVKELVVVRGFTGNYCQTEKGVRWLGKRLGEWLLDITGWGSASFPRYSHISVVAHSLGGLVQTYAVGYVHAKTHGAFFQAIHPVFFVTLATPWLGVAGEHPSYIGKALSYGIIGKTGQDLSLTPLNHSIESRPFLVLMSDPSTPFFQAVSFFEKRILFANTTNDYIVPFGTSAMEVSSLGKVEEAEGSDKVMPTHMENGISPTLKENEQTVQSVGDNAKKIHASSEESGSSFSKALKSFVGLFSYSASKTTDTEIPLVKNEDENARKPTEPNCLGSDELDVSNSSNQFFCSAPKLDPTSTFSGVAQRVVNTFTNLFIPAVPTDSYFFKYHLHKVVVSDNVHDPAASFSTFDGITELNNMNNGFLSNEITIAKNWHRLAWRKVAVRLDGDAHNTMIVRRRFPNAYGWTVIKHLTEILFEQNTSTAYMNPISFDETTTAAWLSEIYEDNSISV
ncbi:putative lipase C4A8.10 [Schizosaccharomyces pombe]